MPADPSGVTTDDQGHRRTGRGDPTSAPGDRGEATSTAAGEPRGEDKTTDSSPTGSDARITTDQGGRGSSSAGASSPVAASSADRQATSTTANDADDDTHGRHGGDSGADAGAVTWPDPAGSPGGDSGADAGAVTWPDPAPGTGTGGPAAEMATDPRPEHGPATLDALAAAGEPPPAPVLTAPPAHAGRRGRSHHRSTRADRAARRGLRVNQRLWSIDPWSVFKLSALFYLCFGLILLVAGTLLYNAGRSVGTIDQFEGFVTRMGAYGECTPKAEVPEGAKFEEDEDKCQEGEVLVGGFALDDGTLFRAAAIGGTILVVAGSIGNVLLTVLVNLLNELTGGLRHTVVKEPVPRPPGSGSARSPGADGRSPSGSLRRRLQR